MLRAYQILKMAKPYLDQGLVNLSKKLKSSDSRIHVGSGFWSNGFCAFREDAPKADKIEPILDSFFPGIEAEIAKFDMSVVPVEIRPLSNGDKVAIRFQNHIAAGWVDGRYVSAILKRHKAHTTQISKRKSGAVVKEPKSPIVWKVFARGVVAQVDGQTVAVLMGLSLRDGDLESPEWALKSEGED